MTEPSKPPFIPPEVLRASAMAEAIEKQQSFSKAIPPNPQIALTRKQVDLTKELVQNAKSSDARSKRAEVISWIAVFVSVVGIAISAIQLFKG